MLAATRVHRRCRPSLIIRGRHANTHARRPHTKTYTQNTVHINHPDSQRERGREKTNSTHEYAWTTLAKVSPLCACVPSYVRACVCLVHKEHFRQPHCAVVVPCRMAHTTQARTHTHWHEQHTYTSVLLLLHDYLCSCASACRECACAYAPTVTRTGYGMLLIWTHNHKVFGLRVCVCVHVALY